MTPPNNKPPGRLTLWVAMLLLKLRSRRICKEAAAKNPTESQESQEYDDAVTTETLGFMDDTDAYNNEL